GSEVGGGGAEVGVAVGAEEQVERPGGRAVLADLLGEGVLMEIEDDQNAAPLAELHDSCDPGQVAGVVPSGLGLERAPVDRQPEQVESEGTHALGVALIEGGNVLERQASVREGDIEDALRSRVHAPQCDLAAPLIAQATLEEPEPSAVDGGPRTGHGDEDEGEEREDAAHAFSVPA